MNPFVEIEFKHWETKKKQCEHLENVGGFFFVLLDMSVKLMLQEKYLMFRTGAEHRWCVQEISITSVNQKTLQFLKNFQGC